MGEKVCATSVLVLVTNWAITLTVTKAGTRGRGWCVPLSALGEGRVRGLSCSGNCGCCCLLPTYKNIVRGGGFGALLLLGYAAVDGIHQYSPAPGSIATQEYTYPVYVCECVCVSVCGDTGGVWVVGERVSTPHTVGQTLGWDRIVFEVVYGRGVLTGTQTVLLEGVWVDWRLVTI